MNPNRRKNKLTAKQVRKLIIAILIAAVIITAAVIILRKKVAEEYGSASRSDITSAEVTSGSISTTVSGSGTLSDDDVVDIEVPDGVEIKKLYVSRGDSVVEGDILASVNTNTVLTAMADKSDEIAELDEEINEAADETVDSTITSKVSGRVKKIFAAEDDNVAAVMYDNEALMLISMDGYMAADIDSEALSEGDEVTVTDAEGNEYEGTVEKTVGTVATVLIKDNEAAYGAAVTVSENGTTVGEGTLYIHDELKIVGFAGTVDAVNTKLNASVSAGTKLITLTDTSYTATYETLLSERAELEEELQQLVKIYKEGGIFATLSGTVKTVSAEEGVSTASTSSSTASAQTSASSFFGGAVSTQSTSSSSSSDSQYISISPDKTMSISVSIDESDILAISVGQSAVVTIDSISGETFEGTVTEIDRSGTSSGGVTVYTASISIEKTSAMLSGMSAGATITIDSVDNTLMIPVDALNKTSTSYFVYTSYDEINNTLGDMVEVTVGISNSNYVEITSGLSEGDTVYYTEAEEEFSFGGMGFGGGDFPSGDFSMSLGNGDMPSGGGFSGGNMPSGGGFSGGNMPGNRG